MLVAILAVQVIGVLVLWLVADEVRGKVDRLYTLLREFDGGVAKSFDTVDREIAIVKDELLAPRCEAGGCKRRAEYAITTDDDTIYSCSEHDSWGDGPDVIRRAV